MKGNSQYNSTINGFLLSGIVTGATGTLAVFGMKNFIISSEGVANGAVNPSGTLNINGRVHPSAQWFNLQKVNFISASGAAVYSVSNYPLSEIQAIVSPITGGIFNVNYAIST